MNSNDRYCSLERILFNICELMIYCGGGGGEVEMDRN